MEQDIAKLGKLISSHRFNSDVAWDEDLRLAEVILKAGYRLPDHTDKMREAVDKIISTLKHKLDTTHYNYHYDYQLDAVDQILALFPEPKVLSFQLYWEMRAILRGFQIKQQKDKSITWRTALDDVIDELAQLKDIVGE